MHHRLFAILLSLFFVFAVVAHADEGFSKNPERADWALSTQDGGEDTPTTSGLNWTLILVAGGAFVVSLGGLGYLVRKSWTPPVDQDLDPDRHPVGLGGWLILPFLGLILGVIFRLIFFKDLSPLFDQAVWDFITSPGSLLDHPLILPLISLEIIFEVTLLVNCCLSLILFFLRKRLFPKLAILGYALMLSYSVIEAVFNSQMTQVFSREEIRMATIIAGQAAVASAIWIPYMCVSERVRNTFVR